MLIVNTEEGVSQFCRVRNQTKIAVQDYWLQYVNSNNMIYHKDVILESYSEKKKKS